ncbi:MAG: class I SAM-dependent methyltransferase [Candidatus Hermodarchaeota archaeon]
MKKIKITENKKKKKSTKNKSEKFWDKISKNYDRDLKRFEPIHIKVIKNTKKYLNASDIVLDYGCAKGTKTFELASNVKKIYGIDISFKMIEGAKKRAKERNVENADFAHTTIFDERCKRESFDVILAFSILHGLEDCQQAMQRIIELLKPGGLFISITPCLKEKMKYSTKFEFYLFLLLSKLKLVPYIKRFRTSELEDLIANGTLQIVEIENIFHKLSSCYIVAKKIKEELK